MVKRTLPIKVPHRKPAIAERRVVQDPELQWGQIWVQVGPPMPTVQVSFNDQLGATLLAQLESPGKSGSVGDRLLRLACGRVYVCGRVCLVGVSLDYVS